MRPGLEGIVTGAPMSRRDALSAIALLVITASGCKKSFRRPPMVYDLGEVKELLYTQQLLRELSMFVARDERGWMAMGTRCTRDGCDLSYQPSGFVCMCCNSVFSHSGRVISGAASSSLPYYQMTYREGHLFADTEFPVSDKIRFMTPELASALERLEERIRLEGVRPGARIPNALLGKEAGQDVDPMFSDDEGADQGSKKQLSPQLRGKKHSPDALDNADPQASPTISLLKRFSFGQPAPTPTPGTTFSPNQ
ncbi:MAG: Rieske 2Fe-2S domain-containing protein [Deltaproteobacteria bacterium]|nr:Rieske 2Fe-2S domain-containing protein [Deltaproteobacteria bacterium]